MSDKRCSKCGEFKLFSEFGFANKEKGYIESWCRACKRDCTRARRGTPPERFFAMSKKYKDNAERQRAWKEANPEKHKANIANRNKDKVRAAQKRWRDKNLESSRARSAQWAKDNPDKAAKNAAARRARVRQATPAWKNDFFIGEIYHLATVRTRVLGVKCVVDHIVPLVSDLVCGLHVEHNLRVITEHENATKSNRWWPDMPEKV